MKYKLADDIVIRNILDECLLVPTGSNAGNKTKFFALNSTGKIIVEAIAAGCDDDGIVAAVCETFDVTENQAREDVREFIDRFAEMDVIEALPD